MGNGYYSGSDFIELGVKSGLVEKAVRKRIETMVKKVSKTAPALINSSFMPDAMKAKYQALLSDRLRFLSVL